MHKATKSSKSIQFTDSKLQEMKNEKEKIEGREVGVGEEKIQKIMVNKECIGNRYLFLKNT